MKTMILRSVLVALVLAPILAFLHIVPRKATTYVPAVEVSEIKDMRYEEAIALMKAREHTYGAIQWLRECGLHSPFFWAAVARSSIAPLVVIFSACVGVGQWHQRRPALP
jgi:hypothetical protein